MYNMIINITIFFRFILKKYRDAANLLTVLFSQLLANKSKYGVCSILCYCVRMTYKAGFYYLKQLYVCIIYVQLQHFFFF